MSIWWIFYQNPLTHFFAWVPCDFCIKSYAYLVSSLVSTYPFPHFWELLKVCMSSWFCSVLNCPLLYFWELVNIYMNSWYFVYRLWGDMPSGRVSFVALLPKLVEMGTCLLRVFCMALLPIIICLVNSIVWSTARSIE